MKESFNYETKELHAMNQDLQTYIDIVNKEREAYPVQNTLYLENITDITITSDSITSQRGGGWR